MKYPKYQIDFGDNPYEFEFYSEGPNGKIRKVILFTPLGNSNFNLGFGDWNSKSPNLANSERMTLLLQVLCVANSSFLI